MSAATYADRTVTVRGLELHYQEWGDPAKPKLLMLHGFGVSGHMFDEFGERAKDSFHLIALDQRGHGDSSWAEDGDYSRDAFVEDVEAFAQAVGLDHFLLMGHSMGGLNSVAYTVRYPHRVQALVLVDVGPEAAKEGVDNIVRFTRGPDELEFNEFVENAMRFNPRRTRENIEERMRHRLKPSENGKWTWKFDKRFRQPDNGLRVGSEATNEQMWEMFTSIPCPVLLVRGEQSDVLKPEVAARCVEELRDCQLVTVPGAGHSVPGDNPDAFTAATLEFLEKHADRVPFEAEEMATPTEVDEGPALSTLVQTNEEAEARRRASLTTAIMLAAGTAAAVVGVGLLMRRRSTKQKERDEAAAALAAEEAAPDAQGVDMARDRAVQLAGDLAYMAKTGAAQARTRLHQIELDSARQSALEIAAILGAQGKAAPGKLRAAAGSQKSKAARKQSARAARSGGSMAWSALRTGFRVASLAATLAAARGGGKKRRKGLHAPKPKGLLAWRS